MIGKTEAKEMVLDLFEEEALVIGGLVAVHGVQDDLVWRLIRNLDVICGRVLRRIDQYGLAVEEAAAVGEPGPKPHPAIAEFLARLRKA